ncbi:jg10577 [Pararge aegeria aegeria]|uniref:Jg10577 protein n=1 Tax=Pararge aegeria aegeria TaxID=348720 RepID=A0A8S4R3E1_9NEOP|nr:jg10577 [Pararge aegeria aegeria]
MSLGLYSYPHPFCSRGYCPRRLREYTANRERVAASSAILLPSSAISNPSAQRGDYGQTLPLGLLLVVDEDDDENYAVINL